MKKLQPHKLYTYTHLENLLGWNCLQIHKVFSWLRKRGKTQAFGPQSKPKVHVTGADVMLYVETNGEPEDRPARLGQYFERVFGDVPHLSEEYRQECLPPEVEQQAINEIYRIAAMIRAKFPDRKPVGFSGDFSAQTPCVMETGTARWNGLFMHK